VSVGFSLIFELVKLNFCLLIYMADASGSLVLGVQELIGTHDLARLGQLIIQNGQWNGEQTIK